MKNLAALDIFVAVAKMQNFTKAAEYLGLTKSTVSRQIRALEEQLGVVLIQRDPRHFSLTDEGFAFFKRGESIIHLTQEAFDEATHIQSSLRGSISISTTADLSLVYLANAVANFSIRHPQIEFIIDLSPRQVDLKAEGFDMAIRPGPLKDSSLYARKIDEYQPHFFASPLYIEKHGRPKSIADFAKHSLVATGKFQVENQSIIPTIVANNMSLVKHLVTKGAGIGMIGEKIVRAEKKEGSLVQILQNLNLPTVPIYIVFPQKRMAKKIAIFAQEILDSKF